MIDHDIDIRALVSLAAQAIRSTGMSVEIKDVSSEEDTDGSYTWATVDRVLLVGGVQIARWSRASMGAYNMDGHWEVSADDSADCLPDAVADLLESLGLDDEYPDIPEPELADEVHQEDPVGEYAVWWETANQWECGVVGRYSTYDAATDVAAQYNRELAARHRGQLLCGYEVRGYADGRWVRIEDE